MRRLLERYRDYHLHEPIMHWYAGLLGTVCFPLFYVLRFTKSVPVYDDLALRLVAAGLCSLLLLRKYWPERLKPYFFGYSYLTLIYTLPFMFVFTALKNGGGTVGVANTLMAGFFVILMTDWRNMVAMLVVGFSTAVLAYWLTDAAPAIPRDYVARFPTLLLVLVGGTFFKMALERASARKVRDAYAAIAGSIAHEMRHPLGQVQHSLEAVQKLLPAPGAWADAPLLRENQLDGLYQHVAQGQQAITRGLQVISLTLDQVNDDKPMDESTFGHLWAAEVVRKAVSDYGYEDPALRERVELQVLEDFQFRGDETAYLYVLFNLLKNALYFVPLSPAMHITITVGAHAVKVRDTGPGIAPQRLPELFEPFRSLGKAGGTGLGLRYCRRVMRAFGGDIDCESREGEYTEFTMRFPPISLAEQEAHAAAVMAKARVQLAGRRLLLVEDDATQRLSARQKLRALELHVDEAPDGQRALELLAQQAYDLVMMDIHMPVLDGWQLAERIRHGAVPKNTRVRLVAHSSEPERAARLKARRAGIDVFVAKPATPVALATALMTAWTQPAAGAPRNPLEGRRVLVADDSPINRRSVVAYLNEAKAEVVEAEHGAGALERLQSGEHIDAVLLDLNMPGLSGFETVRRIRDSGAPWSAVPVVALTAYSDDASMQAARAARMDGYIVKPIAADTLIAALSGLLSGTRSPAASAPANPAAKPAASRPSIAPTEPLLNEQRLEVYRRLDMLKDLVTDYVPEIQRLIGKLEAAMQEGALPQAEEMLHSLVGMSGEAGMQALYQSVRRVYATVREEGRWPATDEWLPPLRTLCERSEQALRAYAEGQAGRLKLDGDGVDAGRGTSDSVR